MSTKLNPKTTQRIKVMLSKLNLMAYSADYALEASNMRTWHISELTEAEAELILNTLAAKLKQPNTNPDAEKAQRQRRRIISICHEMGLKKSDGSIDMEKVNALVDKYGFLKKDGKTKLNDYTAAELPKLVTQFDRMKEYYLHKKTQARNQNKLDDAIARDNY